MKGTGGSSGAVGSSGVNGTGGTSTGGASTGGSGTSSGGTSSGGRGGTASGGVNAGGGGASGGANAGGVNGGGGRGGGGVNAGGTNGGGGAGGGPTKPFCAVPATLKEAGACTGRPIGTALASSHLSESAYVTAAKEFNLATPENEMKWDATEPTKGNFTFSAADQIVSFAKQNGMKVKGHTLVWHMQLPTWVQNLSSAADVRSAMVNHITSVINHFKSGGVVTAWDVVNEAWENDGSALRDSPFSRQLGTGFIDEAFAAARAADPNAKLYYNDFHADGLDPKSDAIYTMLKGMVDRKVPIDGLGLQMHGGTPNPYPTVAEIKQNMQRIADLGLEILISEMDAHVCDGLTSQQQATWYHDVVEACVAQPKCTAITFWGTTDKYSWLNSFTETNCNGKDPSGCLWDNNYMKKPAYTAVMNALTGR